VARQQLVAQHRGVDAGLTDIKSMRFDFGDGFVNVIGCSLEVLGFVHQT
jgi:hypothetical protein